jgi:hypothetical protein
MYASLGRVRRELSRCTTTLVLRTHGLNLKMSSEEPGVAFWFILRYLGSSTVRTFGPFSGQWSQLGIRAPFPSHSSHPMVQPWLNQKHAWPLVQRIHII